jgi:hypothetical protein
MYCGDSYTRPDRICIVTNCLYHRYCTAGYRFYEASQWRKLSIPRHYPFCEVGTPSSSRRKTIALRTLAIGNSFPCGARSVFEYQSNSLNTSASLIVQIVRQTSRDRGPVDPHSE